MENEARTAAFAERIAQPSILATYHVADDQTVRELTGTLSPDIRFPIGSVSKTIAALLVARLSVDGAVDLDEPLGGDGTDPVTLRTLLGHTARIPSELYPDHWDKTTLTPTELDAALHDPPRLGLPPGTAHYSNLGYAMVARRLEEITGQDYAALLSERLLQPLEMRATSYPDGQTEGPCVLGAAAPSGDLWSSLHDLMALARAIGGHRPDVVTWRMLSLLLTPAVHDQRGVCLGVGIRTHRIRHHRVLVSTGTISDRTACVTVWPRRGASVLVAERGFSHESLWRAAARRWRRSGVRVRTWWWDGQEVIELRHGDTVELVVEETTWPFAIFAGEAHGDRLIGRDWRGGQLELVDKGDVLIGDQMRLTSEVATSADTGVVTTDPRTNSAPR
jgi:CubicO group peptidase (beta-lactamase class C family)